MNEIKQRQLILIKYLQELCDQNAIDFKIKAEYSTNDNDKKVIVVQEMDGEKQVFYGDIAPLYNYYEIIIYGLSIQECKEISLFFGNLIGKQILFENKNGNKLEKWNMIFIQNTNPQFIEYKDIRRVGYSLSLQCVINLVYEEAISNE